MFLEKDNGGRDSCDLTVDATALQSACSAFSQHPGGGCPLTAAWSTPFEDSSIISKE
jgi:hypothetical protein